MTEGIQKQKSYGCIPACPHDGGLFLLVENNRPDEPNFWSFPRGHKRTHEHNVNAALRELEEETGLMPDELIEEEVFTQQYSYEQDGVTVDKKNTYYLALFAKAYPPEVTASEINEARWVTYEQARELMRYQESRETLKEAYLTMTMNGLVE